MNNFKQPSQKANCKDCHKEFDSKLVFGRWVERCNDCKTPFVNAKYVAEQMKRQYVYKHVDCGHGAGNLNPGGYCNMCGNGRDFS